MIQQETGRGEREGGDGVEDGVGGGRSWGDGGGGGGGGGIMMMMIVCYTRINVYVQNRGERERRWGGGGGGVHEGDGMGGCHDDDDTLLHKNKDLSTRWRREKEGMGWKRGDDDDTLLHKEKKRRRFLCTRLGKKRVERSGVDSLLHKIKI